MSLELAERITKALLYEGYILYPYTRRATKNQRRWTFGGVYPRHYVEENPGSDAAMIRAECLVQGGLETSLELCVRFLHIRSQNHGDSSEGTWDAWEEASEREVRFEGLRIEDLLAGPQNHPFAFSTEDGEGIERPILGRVEISAEREGEGEGLFRLAAEVSNLSDARPASRREALLHTMVSTHILMFAGGGGKFISATDPAKIYRASVEKCRNVGVWPVLIGKQGVDQVMLASPIILYDYPEIAPESPGDLFDGAEIDEILSLRILTLTAAEKEEMKRSDPHARAILERVEALSEDDWMKLHGRLRELSSSFKSGDRVRILPRAVEESAGRSRRADALDVVLAGLTARVESVEHSLEGGVYLSVTMDDDPGRDLGLKGQPGHRFYFRPDEVERA